MEEAGIQRDRTVGSTDMVGMPYTENRGSPTNPMAGSHRKEDAGLTSHQAPCWGAHPRLGIHSCPGRQQEETHQSPEAEWGAVRPHPGVRPEMEVTPGG